MAKITNEQLSKEFNLSESFGPTHNGLQVYQVLYNTTKGIVVILKSIKMKMYPIASYGKKDITYEAYTLYFDCITGNLKAEFQQRFNTLKDLTAFKKSVK